MDREIKRITVFCGSSFGTEAVYEKQAYELGETLAKQNIGLVYGVLMLVSWELLPMVLSRIMVRSIATFSERKGNCP